MNQQYPYDFVYERVVIDSLCVKEKTNLRSYVVRNIALLVEGGRGKSRERRHVLFVQYDLQPLRIQCELPEALQFVALAIPAIIPACSGTQR